VSKGYSQGSALEEAATDSSLRVDDKGGRILRTMGTLSPNFSVSSGKQGQIKLFGAPSTTLEFPEDDTNVSKHVGVIVI
jgi:hypothetical protein